MAVSLDASAAVLDLGEVARPIDTVEAFGAPMPLELELGVGNGLFLLTRAAACPKTAFLGVERCAKYLRLAAARVARRGLANVRLVRTTAEDMLFRCLGERSLQAVHVYFPDPWPKKRHHKRRLLNGANVARITDLLEPGGMLRVKTDHEGYAAVILEVLAAERRLSPVDVESAFAEIPPTQYELKFAREGRSTHLFARRRS